MKAARFGGHRRIREGDAGINHRDDDGGPRLRLNVPGALEVDERQVPLVALVERVVRHELRVEAMGRLRVLDVGSLRQPQRRDLRIVARIEMHDVEVRRPTAVPGRRPVTPGSAPPDARTIDRPSRNLTINLSVITRAPPSADTLAHRGARFESVTPRRVGAAGHARIVDDLTAIDAGKTHAHHDVERRHGLRMSAAARRDDEKEQGDGEREPKEGGTRTAHSGILVG